jgi:hypothetical protein
MEGKMFFKKLIYKAITFPFSQGTGTAIARNAD